MNTISKNASPEQEVERLMASLCITASQPATDPDDGLFDRLRFVAEWLSEVALLGDGAALLYKEKDTVKSVVLSQTPGDFIVGRSSACRLSFPQNTRLSRQHFRVWHEAGTWRLSDLCSHNGTFLEGTEGSVQKHLLRDGDIIRAGGEIFVFVDQSAGFFGAE